MKFGFSLPKSFLAMSLLGAIALGCAPIGFSQDLPSAPLSTQETVPDESGFVPTSMIPSRKTIFVHNPDYPPSRVAVYPVSPTMQTDFFKLMDADLAKENWLSMTENVENADYRVNIECAGLTNCTKLRVFILTPKRDVLNGFTIDNVAGPLGFNRKPLHEVVSELVANLQQRIPKLEQGDYGYSHY